MILDYAMPYVGPVVLIVNITAMFLCLRPKRGTLFTLCVLAACAAAIHILTIFLADLSPLLVRFSGIVWVPVMLRLFQGQTFQKLFAIFMPYQLSVLMTHLADAVVGLTIGYESPYALIMYLGLSFIMLGMFLTLVLRLGRRFFDRMFVDGRRGEWVLYSFGAIFSFALILTLEWPRVGAALYFSLILFILWSCGILCFTIINTHEKAAQAHNAETLLVQMNAMREQTEAEKKHLNDMEILRHDMRHEMGIIMELFRTGKAVEAETVFSEWQLSLSKAAPAVMCAEPVLNAVFSRFKRRADDMQIHLNVASNIPGDIPVDTIKFSVMVSNALENALTAADKVTEPDRRAIRVKLIQSGSQSDMQIGLEITNPCAAPVEFDGRGLPVTNKAGHGIGVRSIAAFAEDNGYLLSFSYTEEQFTMRLVMDLEVNSYDHR